MKQCSQCGQKFPSSEFYEGRRQCRTCVAANGRKYRVGRRYSVTLMERECSSCGEIKPAAMFAPSRQIRGGLYPQCKTCMLRQKRARKFGIRETTYDEMLMSQGGRCACCMAELSGPREPCIDHNHRTGVLRELLCQRCNTGIGQARESLEILSSWAKYLRKHGGHRG